MRIILAIAGYFVGVLLAILILAMLSTDSEMGNSFIPANIGGIICAIIGYNLPKKKEEKK